MRASDMIEPEDTRCPRVILAEKRETALLTHVAVRRSGYLFALPAPNQHKDVLALMKENGVKRGEATEGYLDEYGLFLDTHQAADRVRRSRQSMHDSRFRGEDELKSSALWHAPRAVAQKEAA